MHNYIKKITFKAGTTNQLNIFESKDINAPVVLLYSAMGVRAQWIRQTLKAAYSGAELRDTGSAAVSQRANSWAIGPRATLKTNWMPRDKLSAN